MSSASPRLRGTQKLVGVVSQCLRRPSLLLVEVAWRWVAGIPTLWLLYRTGQKIFSAAPLSQTGIAQFSLLEQTRSTQELLRCVDLLLPPTLHAALWLVPTLILLWTIASGIGRFFLIARILKISAPPARLFTTIALQFARILALTATTALWFWSLCRAGAIFIVAPMQETNGEPGIVLYLGAVIALTIAALTLWAVISWSFNAALTAAIAENRNLLSSLRVASHLGWLSGKLVEINLALTVIKLALIVLAMVFSATPLPFETDMTGQSLHLWWLAVLVWYLVASDFYHVVRCAAYTQLWQLWRTETTVSSAS